MTRRPTLNRNADWGEEVWMEDQFLKMKTKFVDQGVPVLVGEFGVIHRTEYPELTGADLDLHLASRTYYNKTLVDKANSKGLRPVYWDNGWAGNDGFALFDRNTAAVIDPDGVASLTGGAAVPPAGGGGGGCTASTASVRSIAVTTINAGGGNKRGQATVTVVNNCGSPIANSTVTGNFTGSIYESGVAAVTNSSGVAVLQTTGTARGSVSVSFCVTNVTASGLSYSSSTNVETCDSN